MTFSAQWWEIKETLQWAPMRNQLVVYGIYSILYSIYPAAWIEWLPETISLTV